MSDKEPVCECGHGIDHHHENGVGCSQWLVDDYCECKQFTDARLAALRAENKRLTDQRDNLAMLLRRIVRLYKGPLVATVNEYLKRNDLGGDPLRSAEPIPMPVIENEGE